MRSYYSFGQIEQDPTSGAGRAALIAEPRRLPTGSGTTMDVRLLQEEAVYRPPVDTTIPLTPEESAALQQRMTELREQALPAFRQFDTSKFTLHKTPTTTAATIPLLAVGALAALMLLK